MFAYMTYLNNIHNILDNITYLYIFLSKSFISRTFTIHRVAGKEEGYIFKPSLPLPPTSQTFKTLAKQLLQRVHLCT